MRGFTILVWGIFITGLAAQTQSADRAMIGPSPPAYTPMTSHQRLMRYLKDTVDPVAFARSAASAGFGQLRNTPHEWGEGGAGYGRRYASSFAQHVTTSTLMYGTSSFFHEDNRYLPSGQTTFGPRLRYSLESTILARHDDGTRHLSYSRLGSFLAAAFISRAWQPHSSRGYRSAFTNFEATVGVAAGFNVLREFLPDLLHRPK